MLWMSTMCRIGIRIPSAFVAHQPSRRFHWSVCEPPLPAPYLNGPVPTSLLMSSLLPVVICAAL